MTNWHSIIYHCLTEIPFKPKGTVNNVIKTDGCFNKRMIVRIHPHSAKYKFKEVRLIMRIQF